MYTYKNKVTGAVISTYGKVTSTEWELVKPSKKKGADAAADNTEVNEDE